MQLIQLVITSAVKVIQLEAWMSLELHSEKFLSLPQNTF